VLSQKWDLLPGVQCANTHTEQPKYHYTPNICVRYQLDSEFCVCDAMNLRKKIVELTKRW